MTVEIVLLVAAIINLILLVWFITSINMIKSRLYDVYDQVFDLRESAENIEKLIRGAVRDRAKVEDEE
jgi:hypothetical protein